MADDFNFWAIVIGIFVTAAVSGGLYWLTQPRHDASDEHADWQGIGDGGSSFIHNGHIK